MAADQRYRLLAAFRPTNYAVLSPEEQWAVDKRLGILDWSGDGGEQVNEFRLCRCLACRMILAEDDAHYLRKFMLFRCKECGGYKGFPEENLLMFLQEGPEDDLQEFIQEVLKDARQKNED